ncbi:hypothetical protein DPMN_072377 [Dreissena polymorpha]|uniref:Uncharacterized protein n=1 Tax=Dreissena polymorpha TaxID=45954 RepID=A0A9D4BWF0_DREPO|nr:hypothetical protein DPMN_072377 [Dreissena polymorpha]
MARQRPTRIPTPREQPSVAWEKPLDSNTQLRQSAILKEVRTLRSVALEMETSDPHDILIQSSSKGEPLCFHVQCSWKVQGVDLAGTGAHPSVGSIGRAKVTASAHEKDRRPGDGNHRLT